SSHDFEPALADLIQATRRDPGNAQAWLTLATVQQVTGDLEAARSSCRRLAGLTSLPIVVTCLASIDGVSGNASAALASLEAVAARPYAESPQVRAWMTTLRAELCERLSRSAQADAFYRRALEIDPADAYAVAAYADFLLDEGRPRDVLRLVAPGTASDP